MLEREWAIESWSRPAVPVAPAASAARVPTCSCPSCPSEFSNDDALQRHLFRDHRPNTLFVRVNGQVAPELLFIDEPLTELKVVSLSSADVSISARWADGTELDETIAPRQSIDLVDRLGVVAFGGELRVSAIASGTTRTYRVYVLQPPEFEHEVLDELVFEAQLPLLDRRTSTWESLRDAATKQETDVESRYLLGFAAYLLACDLESEGDWRNARRHLEGAYNALSPFRSSLARDARAVLEFRMHAMSFLRNRGSNSVFWQAANFFVAPPVLVRASDRPAGQDGIWMDEFQEGLLRAVASFVTSDYAAARDHMSTLPAELASEPGNDRKATVVDARLADAEGRVSRAASLYARLREDPIYGSEALRWT